MRPRSLGSLVLLLLFITASASATLPVLRPDQPVSPVAYGGFLRPVGFTSAGSDGTNVLVFGSTQGSLFVTLVSPTGAAVAPSVRIGASTQVTPSSAVVFTGSHYVVAFNSSDGIMATRVSREGQVLDAQPHKVASLGSVSMAWNGRNLLLVSGGLRYTMLDGDGNTTRVEQTFTGGSLNTSPAVASNGDGFLFAGILADPGFPAVVRARPIDAAGNAGALFAIALLPGGSPSELALATDGHDYLAGITTANGVQSVLVRSDGVVGTPVALSGSFGRTPGVVWNGSEYTVMWARFPDVVGVRIGASGAALDAEPLVVRAGGQEVLGTAATALDTFVLIENSDARVAGMFFRSLPTLTSELLARRVVSVLQVPRAQTNPAMATNGVFSLLVWREATDINNGGGVYGALVDPSGAIGRAIQIAADSREASQPAVASNGRDFMVFWEGQSTDILARRVGVDGNLYDAAPILIGHATADATIAASWSGRAYVAVWTTGSLFTPGGVAVLASAVSSDGVALLPPGAPTQLKAPGNSADSPAIACDMSGCTAAWHAVGIVTAPLTSEGGSAGAAASIVTEPTASRPAVMRHVLGTGMTFFTHQIRIYRTVGAPVSLQDEGSVFFKAVSGGPRVIATIGNGIYWMDTSTAAAHLRFARVSAEGIASGETDVDFRRPLVLASSSQRLFTVYSVTDFELPTERLMLRTLATPDPQLVTPRRRAVR